MVNHTRLIPGRSAFRQTVDRANGWRLLALPAWMIWDFGGYWLRAKTNQINKS